MKTVIDIVEIGKSKSFEDVIVEDFVPDYPTPHGSELIFSFKKLREKHLNTEDLCYLIKGLHFIELKYRQQTKNDFGFGSPSQTSNLITTLNKRNENKAIEITNWIIENGGNYYYKIINNDPPGTLF